MSQDTKEQKKLLQKPVYTSMSGQSKKVIKKWIREYVRIATRALKQMPPEEI